MAAAYQRLLVMLMLVMTTVTTGAGGQDTGGGIRSSSVVRILAVFDQSEMETMERVMHKTLIALNKEKTAWTGSSGGGGAGGRWNRLLNSGIGVNVTSSINNKKSRSKWLASNAGAAARLTVDSVTFSSQWWLNQTAEDLGRLILTHRPVAVLVLSADDRSVFRVALAAAPFQLPVIGARAQRGLDDSSFRVSFFFSFFFVGSFYSAKGNIQIDHWAWLFLCNRLINGRSRVTFTVTRSKTKTGNHSKVMKRMPHFFMFSGAEKFFFFFSLVDVARLLSVQNAVKASGVKVVPSFLFLFPCLTGLVCLISSGSDTHTKRNAVFRIFFD
jgi:hypothetical protein